MSAPSKRSPAERPPTWGPGDADALADALAGAEEPAEAEELDGADEPIEADATAAATPSVPPLMVRTTGAPARRRCRPPS